MYNCYCCILVTTAASPSPTVNADYVGRTTARPCDKEFDLFEMMDFGNITRTQEIACGRNTACTK